MSCLIHKNIVLGVTGGIAAYKSAELVRRLKEAGADVRVVMTAAATEFVTPLTFQALSGHPVHTDLLDPTAEAAMGHIELARWADIILIAPATANTLARLSHGIADNLLSTLCLASTAPIAVAPAMNHVMWSAPANQENIQTLRRRGTHILGPAAGAQACGESGEGRMLEPVDLTEQLSNLFDQGSLQGLKIMLTAGPTYEAIDPVRFIGNRSSGRMGFALAQAALDAGAEVTLIAGPVKLKLPEKAFCVEVESAQQMHKAVFEHIAGQDIFIATAAVADYRPAETHDQKIKKSDENLSIHLLRNADILSEVAALENAPFTVGFAAETQELEHYARQKLVAKKLDMIAANKVANAQINGEDIGFNSAYNALEVFWNDGAKQLPKAHKTELARQLITLISERYNDKEN
ncbi:MAG: bifunctional phosphopantothenoylcysteine decarboxylase/phosphopantothenate--cysteine ligase CoaBC [Gammaproteobacteria bacterium]|nr:bifunctional phosphopantothenoylcysteine decarboxylase/phosphopantothenate--cysteine ligase CoaBC [Gammaproteobacteria bacterium]